MRASPGLPDPLEPLQQCPELAGDADPGEPEGRQGHRRADDEAVQHGVAQGVHVVARLDCQTALDQQRDAVATGADLRRSTPDCQVGGGLLPALAGFMQFLEGASKDNHAIVQQLVVPVGQ